MHLSSTEPEYARKTLLKSSGTRWDHLSQGMDRIVRIRSEGAIVAFVFGQPCPELDLNQHGVLNPTSTSS